MNGTHLARKQLVILGLAMLLAVASYWIPAPQPVSSQSSTPDFQTAAPDADPVEVANFRHAVAASRDEAATPKEDVVEQALPVLPLRSVRAIDEISDNDAKASAARKPVFLAPQEMANGESAHLDNILLVPVKNISF